eukprot:8218567-Pyramimonas_sp.AAC.1
MISNTINHPTSSSSSSLSGPASENSTNPSHSPWRRAKRGGAGRDGTASSECAGGLAGRTPRLGGK